MRLFRVNPSKSKSYIAYTSGSEYDSPATPVIDPHIEEAVENKDDDIAGPNNPREDQTTVIPPTSPRRRRASTKPSPEDVGKSCRHQEGLRRKKLGRSVAAVAAIC